MSTTARPNATASFNGHGHQIFAYIFAWQETPDEIPEGETPATATVFAFDDLVDAVRPGDRCGI